MKEFPLCSGALNSYITDVKVFLSKQLTQFWIQSTL